MTIRIVDWDELARALRRAARPGATRGREGNRGVMVVPAGRSAGIAHTVIHEYGHHVDWSRRHSNLDEPNGTPLWWKARGMAELVALRSVRDRYQVGWNRSIAEVFAEDYAYTNLRRGYRISLARAAEQTRPAGDPRRSRPRRAARDREPRGPRSPARRDRPAGHARVRTTGSRSTSGCSGRTAVSGSTDVARRRAGSGRVEVSCERDASGRAPLTARERPTSLELPRVGPGAVPGVDRRTPASQAERFRFTVRLGVRAAERPPEADEERLEQQVGVEVELLRLAPRLPHERSAASAAPSPATRRVLACRSSSRSAFATAASAPAATTTRSRYHAAEIVERREELVLLRAEARAPDALLRLAGREGRARRPACCSLLARRRAARAAGRDEHDGRRVAAGRTPRRDRRPRAAARSAARCARAASSSSRAARSRRPPATRASSRDLARPRARAPAPASHASTAPRESRRNGTSWQRERIVSGSGPSSSATSTSVAYAGGSSRSLSSARRRVVVHAVRVEDEVDAAIALERPHVEVVVERADLVDPDHLAERLDHPEVGVRPRVDAARVAEQRARERLRGRRACRRPRGPWKRYAWAGPSASAASSRRFASRCSGTSAKAAHGSPRRSRRRAACRRRRRTARGYRAARSRYASATRGQRAPPSAARSGRRLSPTRASAVSGSISTSTVRSGSSPPTTVRFSSRTVSTPRSRPPPW